MTTHTTTKKRNDLLSMFLDATTGEVYAEGRLKTVTDDDGDSVKLVAYNEHVLAEIDRSADVVTLFTGHYDAHSETVNRYIEALGRELNDTEGRAVSVHEAAAPTTGMGQRCAEAAKYIGRYTSLMDGPLSGAEKKAFDDVQRSLRRGLDG